VFNGKHEMLIAALETNETQAHFQQKSNPPVMCDI